MPLYLGSISYIVVALININKSYKSPWLYNAFASILFEALGVSILNTLRESWLQFMLTQ